MPIAVQPPPPPPWSPPSASAPPPAFADPVNPTPAELRRLAMHTNTRALVDISVGGGYGWLYGPGIPLEPGGTPVYLNMANAAERRTAA